MDEATPDSAREANSAADAEFPAISGYRLERLLGEGAFATVYLATSEDSGKRVAVKVLRPELDASIARQVRTRFLLEERIARSLADPRFVKVYATSEPSAEPCFIAMEYLDAEAFSEPFRRRRQAGSAASPGYLRELTRLGYEVAKAMAVAHERGVVHRDLKPSNVLVTRARSDAELPRIKIVDFGIAKAPLDVLHGVSATFTPHHTGLGTVMGSPPYMAPEQNGRAHAVTGKADVFALGIMLTITAAGLDHEALEARRATFALPEDIEQALRLGPELPEELRTLLLAMVRERPSERPDMHEVAWELGRIGQPSTAIAEAVYAFCRHGRVPSAAALVRVLGALELETQLSDDEQAFLRQAPALRLRRQRRSTRSAVAALTLTAAGLGLAYARERSAFVAAQDRSQPAPLTRRVHALNAATQTPAVVLAHASSPDERVITSQGPAADPRRDAHAPSERAAHCRALSDELNQCARQRDLATLDAAGAGAELLRLTRELEAQKHETDDHATAETRCRRDLETRDSELAETANRLRLCSAGLRAQKVDPAPAAPSDVP
jgi:serine/threonine protein kinase